MWPFSARARLFRQLDRLAFYNDKGVYYSRHTPEQASQKRAEYVARIRILIQDIGSDALPVEFTHAVESGALATDDTGKYADLIKAQNQAVDGNAPVARAFLTACLAFFASGLFVLLQAVRSGELSGTDWFSLPLLSFYLGVPGFVVLFPLLILWFKWRSRPTERHHHG